MITNLASDLQREKIRLLDLETRFDFIVVSGEHGATKPNPALLEMVASAWGLAPASIWHVGDNPRADVGGSKAAVVTAVWLNRDGARLPEGCPKPDFAIASLDELAALLIQAYVQRGAAVQNRRTKP